MILNNGQKLHWISDLLFDQKTIIENGFSDHGIGHLVLEHVHWLSEIFFIYFLWISVHDAELTFLQYSYTFLLLPLIVVHGHSHSYQLLLVFLGYSSKLLSLSDDLDLFLLVPWYLNRLGHIIHELWVILFLLCRLDFFLRIRFLLFVFVLTQKLFLHMFLWFILFQLVKLFSFLLLDGFGLLQEDLFLFHLVHKIGLLLFL